MKGQARIDSGHEDTLIESYIAAAEAAIEHLCRRAFRPQVWRSYYTGVTVGKAENLPRSPVSSVTISYRDSATTWAVATATTILDGAPGMWFPPSDVTAFAMPDGSPNWKAEATCGGTADSVPGPIKHAIVMLSAHLFEQRSPIIVGASVADVPFTILALITPYIAPET